MEDQERIAFIIGESCTSCNLNDLLITFSTEARLAKYECEPPKEENSIEYVDLNNPGSLRWLQVMLTKEEVIKKIKYLFIEDNKGVRIPELAPWFKVIVLEKAVNLLPSYISQSELTSSIQHELNKIKRREIKRYLKRRITEESKIDIVKPYTPLTTVRKTILRKQLEKYGKLEDVLKILGEYNNN